MPQTRDERPLPPFATSRAGDVATPRDAGQSPPPAQAGGGEAIDYGACARAIVTARAHIGRYLDPTLFADPAFDILLDLLASEQEGRKVNMSGCAYAARVARTTALRWVCTLEERGLVERACDESDQRTTLVRLTAEARSALIGYLQRIARAPMLR